MSTHHIPILSRFSHRVKFLVFYVTISLISIPAYADVLMSSITSIDTPSTLPPICMALEENLARSATDLTADGAVTTLQDFLFEYGYYPHSGVGEFGWLTFFAVVKFQNDNDLPGTGFFGPMTRSYIYESECAEPNIPPITPLTTIETIANNTNVPVEIFPPADVTSTPIQEETLASTTNSLSLPYQSSLFWNEWHSDWGSATTSPDGVLLLRATASTTGATALLPDSKEWTDYSYTADITFNVNGSFSLLGRYTDAKNFLSCTFADHYVSINETLDGVRKQVTSVRLHTSISSAVLTSTNVRMEAHKNRITCSRTGAEDVSYTLSDTRLMKGGIGISNWFTIPGVSTLDLRSVKVVGI